MQVAIILCFFCVYLHFLMHFSRVHVAPPHVWGASVGGGRYSTVMFEDHFAILSLNLL